MKQSLFYTNIYIGPKHILLLTLVFALTIYDSHAKNINPQDTTISPGMNPANFDDNKEPIFESLPVKLIFFKLTVNPSHILLSWATSLERNNRGFEIERKLKGANHFETIAFIPTKHAGGNYDLETHYTYSDPNKFQYGTQYRLKQIDLNGRISYSKIVLADGVEALAKSILYPNPVSSNQATLVFSTERKRTITLSNLHGQPLKIFKTSDSFIEMNDLNKGVYLLTIHDLQQGNYEALKMVVN